MIVYITGGIYRCSVLECNKNLDEEKRSFKMTVMFTASLSGESFSTFTV